MLSLYKGPPYLSRMRTIVIFLYDLHNYEIHLKTVLYSNCVKMNSVTKSFVCSAIKGLQT